MTAQRQIFAYSGIVSARDGDLDRFALTEHALRLTGVHDRAPRVCYVPTAVGDAADSVRAKREQFAARRPDVDLSVLTLFPRPAFVDVRSHLLGQDLVLVEGGSVVNLMAVWRAHGLPAILRECWSAGVVLAGSSAGSLCWHVGGPTDSLGDDLAPFTDGLALVPFSNGVHDDLTDQPRRRIFRELVATGGLPAGHSTEDGVGLHYVGTALAEAVTIRPGARAALVERQPDGTTRETVVTPRPL